jgi:hypothetical protein
VLRGSESYAEALRLNTQRIMHIVFNFISKTLKLLLSIISLRFSQSAPSHAQGTGTAYRRFRCIPKADAEEERANVVYYCYLCSGIAPYQRTVALTFSTNLEVAYGDHFWCTILTPFAALSPSGDGTCSLVPTLGSRDVRQPRRTCAACHQRSVLSFQY